MRTDRGGEIDTDKASGADGIVGPYREKEGSFYTIKEIWSPIYVAKKYITPTWDGKFTIENRYDFTNAKRCSFSYTLAKFNGLSGERELFDFDIIAPDINPGNRGELQLMLPENWQQYDVLYLTAKDFNGMELFTWSYELNSPAFFVERVLQQKSDAATVSKTENDSLFILSENDVIAKFSKATGLLLEVSVGDKLIPLSNGPIFITDEDLKPKNISLKQKDGAYVVEARYFYPNKWEAYRFAWTMQNDGTLQLDYNYRPADKVAMCGVTFDFPEEGVEGAQLFANGPYRVYNNRLKGGDIKCLG